MRDQRLVLDDQDARGDLTVDLGEGGGDQGMDLRLAAVGDEGGLGRAEAFERREEQDLPASGRDGGKALAGGALAGGDVGVGAGSSSRPRQRLWNSR